MGYGLPMPTGTKTIKPAHRSIEVYYDTNRPNDPEYIVRLIGQVIHVSLDAVRIVNGLPEDFGG